MKSLLTCLAAAWIALASMQTHGHPPTNSPAAYMEAAAKMDQRIAQRSAEGSMPRITEPETSALIDVLSDSHRFLESRTYTVDNIGELMEICGQANRVSMAYALFGMKERLAGNGTTDDITRQMTMLMEENILSFQPELEQLHPFLLRCLAKEVQPLAAFMAALPPQELTPTRLAGLKQFRGGLLNSYSGHLISAGNPALRPSYRRQVLQAMAESSPAFASALQPPIRQQIAQTATDLIHDAPAESRADIEAIIKAMSTPDCTGLCAY
jgi:hypothetical protein